VLTACLVVCLFVGEHISRTTCPIFTNLLCTLPISVSRGSVFLWRRCDMSSE